MGRCTACGTENADSAKFCQECGTALLADEGGTGTRKIVTVVFTDVTGSTRLGERLDPELFRRVMSRFYGAMRPAIERHGGLVEKFIGDAVVAVFGVPTLHEDDAVRAVRAAADMRDALRELNEELQRRHGITLAIRTGINTGEVLAEDPSSGHGAVIGDAVNVAARLEEAAEPGEILLGAATYSMAGDGVVAEAMTPLSLKGKSEPVPAFRLVAVDDASAGGPWRMDSPLVGRDDEQGLLDRALDRAVRGRMAFRLSLLGAAGIGKSRLVMEFAAGLKGDALVLQGRCLPYGEGITFWPVAQVVKQACGITDDDPPEQARSKIAAVLPEQSESTPVFESVSGLLGLSQARTGMQETFWAVRRLFEHLAADRPAVVVFDDIHWAEPTFLDLVDYLVGSSEGAAILYLCLARPELLDVRPSWRHPSPTGWSAMLGPLTDDESRRLMENLLGSGHLAPGAWDRIAEAAEGNPLFVEEMLRMLADDELLRPATAGHWESVRDLSDVAVPPTIHALIGARLDRLSTDERAVTRRASIAGKVFWWGAVTELSPPPDRPAVGTHLQTLVRKELIRPERSAMEGEDAFRFHHLLIRDAAYQGTPKVERAELHERFAGWLERTVGDRAPEYEEVLGYHLEQACRYRLELGPSTDHDREVARRAAQRLSGAGRRAFSRGDMPAAANLLERAAALLPADDTGRLELMPDLAEALMEGGDFARAGEVLDEAIERAAAGGEPRVEAHATIVRLLLKESTAPEGRSDEALRELKRVIPVFEGLGDELGLARSYRLTGDVYWSAAQYAAVDEALRKAVDHARRAGAVREEAESMGQFAGSGLYGPAPVEEVVRRCEEILRASPGSPTAEARALRTLGACRAMAGRFDEARDLVRRSGEMLADLGLHLRAAFASQAAGFVEMLAGDPAAAERELRLGYEAMESLGEQGYLSTASALLSDAVFACGRPAEAEALTRTAEETGATDDLSTQVVWRSVRAKVLATRGEPGDAEALALEAVSLAAQTDDVNMQGDALMDLAQVLRLCHRDRDAAQPIRRAMHLYEAKGNRVSAERARSLLGAAVEDSS